MKSAEEKIITSRRAIADLQEFIDTARGELANAATKAARAKILARMKKAALEIQKLTDIIESASAELAQAKNK